MSRINFTRILFCWIRNSESFIFRLITTFMDHSKSCSRMLPVSCSSNETNESNEGTLYFIIILIGLSSYLIRTSFRILRNTCIDSKPRSKGDFWNYHTKNGPIRRLHHWENLFIACLAFILIIRNVSNQNIFQKRFNVASNIEVFIMMLLDCAIHLIWPNQRTLSK